MILKWLQTVSQYICADDATDPSVNFSKNSNLGQVHTLEAPESALKKAT